MELKAVFQINTFRRVLLECIIRMIWQRVSHNKSSEKRRGRRSWFRAPSGLDEPSPTDASIVQDLEKEVYEQFDDFMDIVIEIVIEIGYVTLFTSACTWASLISIAANWVEMRSYCHKLTHVCQRPDPYRSSSLGMWKPLMASII